MGVFEPGGVGRNAGSKHQRCDYYGANALDEQELKEEDEVPEHEVREKIPARVGTEEWETAREPEHHRADGNDTEPDRKLVEIELEDWHILDVQNELNGLRGGVEECRADR